MSNEIKMDYVSLENTIETLKSIATEQEEKRIPELSIEGKMGFTDTGLELWNLVEQTRQIWGQVARVESVLIQKTMDNFKAVDEAMGKGFSGEAGGLK
jgi:hypothetical protein